VKIGIQTRPWGSEKNRQQLSEVLAEIASVGYDGIEIGAQHLDIAKPREFRALVANHKLDVAGIHVGGEIYNPQAVKDALDNLAHTVAFAAEAGAMFLAFSGKAKENKSEDEFRIEAESLNRVGELCRQQGLRLAYHNHYWEIENDCHELQYLCAHTDANLVSLCLDVAWVQRGGENPAQVAREFLDRIAYIHIKDTTIDEWKELGKGTVDLQGVLDVVRSRAFPWLVIEQDETKLAPIESARISREYLGHELGR
jgi:sugar phosphate isomerase/epimerase